MRQIEEIWVLGGLGSPPPVVSQDFAGGGDLDPLQSGGTLDPNPRHLARIEPCPQHAFNDLEGGGSTRGGSQSN